MDEPKILILDNVRICESCVNGEGEECHTPGCLLNLQDVPNWTKKFLLEMGVEMRKEVCPKTVNIRDIKTLLQRLEECRGTELYHYVTTGQKLYRGPCENG